MKLGLEDRVAVVTGAAGGVGSAVCRALADEAAHVVAADVSDAALDRAAGDLPDGALRVAADMAAPDAGRRLVDATLRHHGRLDVLVLAAGVYETSAVGDLDVETWDRVQHINLRGAFLCAQAAIPVMVEHGWGRIVTVSSIAAATGGSISASTAYVSSKAAVAAMTRSLAGRVGEHGVTVNCIVPGMIDTPMIADWAPAVRDRVIASTPLRRSGRPAEVAAMVVVLASEAASFVSGAHLTVAGGLVMD